LGLGGRFISRQQVSEQSLASPSSRSTPPRKQLKLESIPEMDVMRAEAEVSKRDQDVTVARTTLQLQELLIKKCPDAKPG